MPLLTQIYSVFFNLKRLGLIPEDKNQNNSKILKTTVSAHLEFSQRGNNNISELNTSLLAGCRVLFLLLTLQKAFGTSQDHISIFLGNIQCQRGRTKC